MILAVVFVLFVRRKRRFQLFGILPEPVYLHMAHKKYRYSTGNDIPGKKEKDLVHVNYPPVFKLVQTD